MPTPNQKQDECPISFILHNLATGAAPVKHDLVIRPEDLVRTHQSRLMVHQTLGGAWADSWGYAPPTVQISGTTGWGQGSRKDGQEQFKELHSDIFKAWHKEREKNIQSGLDPDQVKMIFADMLNKYIFVVAPQNFILKRNKARPLLSQYQIGMTWVENGITYYSSAMQQLLGEAKQSPFEKIGGILDSLKSAVGKIKNFAKGVVDKIKGFTDPIVKGFSEFTKFTAGVLGAVTDTIAAGRSIVKAVSDPLVNIGKNLARAATNVCNVVNAVKSIPQMVKAEIAKVASAFNNVACVLKNGLKGGKQLPKYDALYGASTCSSTAGGRPPSKYDTVNPFPELLPIDEGTTKVSSAAVQATNRLAGIDVLDAPSSTQVSLDMQIIMDGVRVA